MRERSWYGASCIDMRATRALPAVDTDGGGSAEGVISARIPAVLDGGRVLVVSQLRRAERGLWAMARLLG